MILSGRFSTSNISRRAAELLNPRLHILFGNVLKIMLAWYRTGKGTGCLCIYLAGKVGGFAVAHFHKYSPSRR